VDDSDSFRFQSAAPSPGAATVAAQVARIQGSLQKHQDVLLWRQRAAIPWESY
jgi:hypothetical protein